MLVCLHLSPRLRVARFQTVHCDLNFPFVAVGQLVEMGYVALWDVIIVFVSIEIVLTQQRGSSFERLPSVVSLLVVEGFVLVRLRVAVVFLTHDRLGQSY